MMTLNYAIFESDSIAPVDGSIMPVWAIH